MNWQVDWERKAARELAALPIDVQRRIGRAITRYADAGEGDVRRLQGSPDFRLRVGDYRVIFAQDGKRFVILVVQVGHRREVYR